MAVRNRLIILGAGNFGREVAWMVERLNAYGPAWELVGFLDDTDGYQGKKRNGVPVLGKISDVQEFEDAYFICAIANATGRRSVIARVKRAFPDARFATLIDSEAIVAHSATIKEGSIVCAHAVVAPGTSVGRHVIVDVDSSIGSGVLLCDYVTLYPSVNVGNSAYVGACTELGVGTQVEAGVRVGDNSVVGAGSVVLEDIPANCTTVGNPAKPIKQRNA